MCLPTPVTQASPSSLAETRHRLLEAAGEVFAEHGFRGATVREICNRAGANVAAVNYHFRDKETLYRELIRYAHRCAFPAGNAVFEPDPSTPPERRLREYVRHTLAGILGEGRPAWLGKLIGREMSEPTGALDMLVEEGVRPRFAALTAIIGALLGPGASPQQVRLCAFSVQGQCLFYHFAKPVMQRLVPAASPGAADLDRLTDHVTDFSLAAIRGLVAGSAGGATGEKGMR